MANEQFAEIRARLDELMSGQAELRREMHSGFEQVRGEMRAGHEELRGEMRAGHEELRGEMRAGHEELRGEMREVAHQMRVLHEDTIDRIAALAPDFEPIRREFKAGDAELREDIDRRLTPLEAAMRRRSK